MYHKNTLFYLFDILKVGCKCLKLWYSVLRIHKTYHHHASFFTRSEIAKTKFCKGHQWACVTPPARQIPCISYAQRGVVGVGVWLTQCVNSIFIFGNVSINRVVYLTHYQYLLFPSYTFHILNIRGVE
jgi:hypothetical protein